MASQQAQDAATQLMSAAPWQNASTGSAMESLTQSLVDALKDATTSVDHLTTIQESQSGSAIQTAENVLTSVIGGQGGIGSVVDGLGGPGGGSFAGGGLLSPLITGIISLFGSGGHSTPPPLTRFTLPPAIEVGATGGASTGGQLAGSDYGADGLPRAQTTSNVTVQVNAMDSRSFLDRSSDIATAVRQAILSSHSINDVLAEL